MVSIGLCIKIRERQAGQVGVSKQNLISVFGVNWKKSNSLRIQIWCTFFYCTYSYFTALLDITVVSSYRNQQLFLGLSQYLRNCFNAHTSLNKFVLLYFTRHSFNFVNVFNNCQPPWSVSRINYIDKERVRSY